MDAREGLTLLSSTTPRARGGRLSHRWAQTGAWAALALLTSCQSPLHQADLETFVTDGLTNVELRSAQFATGSQALTFVPSGQTVSGQIDLINPTNLTVTYALSWDVSDSFFLVKPSAAPTPADTTHVVFSFSLDPTRAEHKTIHFTLGKYVASINKTFSNDTLTVVCDSPPHDPTQVAAANDSAQRSVLGITLPTQVSDDDLRQLKITWSQDGTSTSTTETRSIDELRTAPSPNPFGAGYDCYFEPSGVVAGASYSYTVSIIDAVGQESGTVSTSSTANAFQVIYDGNGADGGTPPATTGYHYHATATVASPGSLTKTSYAFSSWTTAADGSGVSYSPGDTFQVPASNTTLYAQWITNQVNVTVDLGTQALTFSGPTSVNQGGALSVTTGNATLAAGGTNWVWYVDGVQRGSGSSTFVWNTGSETVGQHVISALVTYNGVNYSGSSLMTVTP